MEEFDLIVVGGGNAYRVADMAGSAGRRTALVEGSLLGGTCPNRGCIPSKLLLCHADAADAVRRAGEFHVRAELHGIDRAAVLRDSFAYTARTDARFEKRLPDTVRLFRGFARFVGERTLDVDGTVLRGARVVIATGSRPRLPDAAVAERSLYWTSDDVFTLTTLPASIAIIGGGLVGCEFASFFTGMGVPTHLVFRGPEVLGDEDADIRAHVQDALGTHLTLHPRTEVAAVRGDGDERVLTLTDASDAAHAAGDGRPARRTRAPSAPQELRVGAVLFAIGRVPALERLDPERAGVELTERGAIRVDERLRTRAKNVWAMGDVIDRHPFTHAASHEAHYLGRVLTGEIDEPLEYGPMPHAVFCHPPVGAVGPTEEQLVRDGVEHVAVSVPFSDTAMGHGLRERHGLCKLLVAPDRRILGAHLVGHEAPTLLHGILPFLHWHNDVRALAGMIHVHPALNEVVQAAAREAVSALGKRR